MKRILPLLIVLAAGGCLWPWEPYPDWTVKQISHDELPREVRREFSEAHGSDRIVAVEQSTSESRIEGHPKLYRITFVSETGLTNRIVYDKKGTVTDGGHWFELYDIQHTNMVVPPVHRDG